VAGSWYPGSAQEIAAELDAHLAGVAGTSVGGRLVGLISPHAGLRYSGPVAAHAYALLRGRAGLTVVLVGPSHHFAFDGVALWARGRFETPLGSIPVDEELSERLLSASGAILDGPRPHVEEHSLEMQLPFLQHLCPDLRVVAALMGRQGAAEIDALAGALAASVPESSRPVVLVASSDLSHYRPAALANRIDALVVTEVEHFRPEGLLGRLVQSPEHACGGGPMVAVMKAARALGATRSQVLRYADSGDAGERNKARVVGYLAAALLAPA
jgi:MEMO1 family protein